MGPHLARAQLLLEQGRYDLAEQELRLAIAEEPEPALAHGLLAICLVQGEKFEDATREAREAIHREPDLAFAHYAHATVLLARRREDEADAAAAEALRLNADEPAYHALTAQIRMNQRRWTEALAAAEGGLRIDAEHGACNNLRAMALVKLGRRDEAGATIEGALARQPEDATTHANQGWTLLHQAQPKKAMEHFREALRLEPDNEWARAGIVEALKARNPIYGFMLRYFLWMSRLSRRAQWMVILGGYFGQRGLRSLADSNPKFAPYVWPVIYLYAAFVLMSWISVPLFNLFLRIHPFGRYALSPDQRRASNWVGACLLLLLGSLVAWLGFDAGLGQFGTITFGLLLLPLCGVFNCHEGWPAWTMAALTASLFLLRAAVLAVILASGPHPGPDRLGMIGTMNAFFYLGAFASTFIANALAGVVPRR